MSAQAEAKPTTKQRLAAIVQGFDEFDSDMKTGTRVSVGMCPMHQIDFFKTCIYIATP